MNPVIDAQWSAFTAGILFGVIFVAGLWFARCAWLEYRRRKSPFRGEQLPAHFKIDHEGLLRAMHEVAIQLGKRGKDGGR